MACDTLADPKDIFSGKRVAIIGHTGFVGGTLHDSIPNAECFNSSNIEDIAGASFDIIICSGLCAAKWWINENAEVDLRSMLRLQECLERVTKCNYFVLISTIDVYDVTVPYQTEEPSHLASHAYGIHRFKMESWATRVFEKCTILRLPGLFGLGLKKNIIYDMLNDRLIDSICASHAFQWYDMRDLFDDVVTTLSKDASGVYNLFTEPVTTAELVQAAFPEYWPIVSKNTSEKPNVYCVKTQHAPSGWVSDKASVLKKIQSFVSLQRKISRGLGDLLAISNLAWSPDHDDHAMRLVRKYGITNVEIAPTRYGPWDDTALADKINVAVKTHGLDVCSLQAVFFGMECGLFDEDDAVAFKCHFKRVLEVSKKTGARKIVFGSPRNRKVLGSRFSRTGGMASGINEEAMAFAAGVFLQIAKDAASIHEDILICFEPNSAKYGCDFVTTAREAIRLVRRVDHRNFRMNLDTGNARMEGEDLEGILVGNEEEIGHVQVSMPFLAPLNADAGSARILRLHLPEKIFSLEMKQVAGYKLPKLLADLYSYVA